MFSVRSSSRLGVYDAKAFSSFFWVCKDRNSYEVSILRPKRGNWDWLNQCHERSLTPAYVTKAATGSSGEPAESSSHFPLEWDPFEDLFGLGVDLRSRKDTSVEKPRQKYELQMPCPTCEGRGYLLCPHCNLRKSEDVCSYCSGRGYHDCLLCHGECVVWEDFVHESTSRATHHSRSPLQVADDDAIESMAITPVPKRKTSRVYGSPRPETVEKIRRALKDLEARTGSISKRMKNVHLDPVLRAQRTAAIKKARGTDEAKQLTSQRLKEYFKSPENRLKHSQKMTGLQFTCTACGEGGHRRHFCPKLGFKRKEPNTARSYHCSFCGQIGHGCRRCPKKQKQDSCSLITQANDTNTSREKPRGCQCGLCRKLGHTKRTCPKLERPKRLCSKCGLAGHNCRTCTVAAPKQ